MSGNARSSAGTDDQAMPNPSAPKSSWSRLGRLLLLTGIVSSTACVTGPVDGTHLASQSTPVTIEAYAANGGANVRVEGRLPGGGWTTFDNLTASTTAFQWDNRLYRVYGSVVVPSGYWDNVGGEFGSGTSIRLIEEKPPGGNQTVTPLRTFEQSGLNCLYAAIGNGDDFVVAGNNCYTGTTIHLTAP